MIIKSQVVDNVKCFLIYSEREYLDGTLEETLEDVSFSYAQLKETMIKVVKRNNQCNNVSLSDINYRFQ